MKEYFKRFCDILLNHFEHTVSSRFKLSLYILFLGFILAMWGKLTNEFVMLSSVIAAFYNAAKTVTDIKNNKNGG